MSSAPITTVYDTSDTGQIELFRQRLSARLPLEKLRRQGTPSQRSHKISSLWLNLVPFEPGKLLQLNPSLDLNYPILHIALVYGEDSAIYKQSVKGKLQGWHRTLRQVMCGSNWLVIHITPKVKGRGLRTLHLFDTLFDKLKNDFSTKTTVDRFLQLAPNDGDVTNSEELWGTLLDRVGQEVVAAFSFRITYLDSQIRIALETSSLKGENPKDTDFCTYFLLKDLYANMLESMNLRKEALESYDELEKVFELYLSKRTPPCSWTDAESSSQLENETESSGEAQWLRWFGPTCNDSCTHAIPLSESIDAEHLRSRIGDQKALIVEMRIYILNKQIRFLLQLRQPAVAAHRVLHLLQQVLFPEMRLRWPEAKQSYVCQWVVVTCLGAVKFTENYIAESSKGLGARSRVDYALACATLCVVAKERLEELGIYNELLPIPQKTFLRFGPNIADIATPEPFQRRDSTSNDSSLDSSDPSESSTVDMFPSLSVIDVGVDVDVESMAKSSSGSSARPPHMSSSVSSIAIIIENDPVEVVQEALKSVSEFDDLYLKLCQCAIDSFKRARRQRSSLSILCDMAHVFFNRQHYEQAAQRFAMAASHFRSDGWFELEVRLLQPLLQCYKAVNRKDQFVATCLRMISVECPISIQEKSHYLKKLQAFIIGDTEKVNSFLGEDAVDVSANEIFCSTESIVELTELRVLSKDGPRSPRIELTVLNTTAFDLHFQEISLIFEERTSTATSAQATLDQTPSDSIPLPDFKSTRRTSPKISKKSSFSGVDLESPEKSVKQTRAPPSLGYLRSRTGSQPSTQGYHVSVLDDEVDGDDQPSPIPIDTDTRSSFMLADTTSSDEDGYKIEYRQSVDGEVVVHPGSKNSKAIILVSNEDIEGSRFVATKAQLRMGKITLISAALPECEICSTDQTPFNLHVKVEKPSPLLVNTNEKLSVVLSTSRELSENVIRISTSQDLQLRVMGREPLRSGIMLGGAGARWGEYAIAPNSDKFEMTLKLDFSRYGDAEKQDIVHQRQIKFQAFGVGKKSEYISPEYTEPLQFSLPFKVSHSISRTPIGFFFRLSLENSLSDTSVIEDYELKDVNQDVVDGSPLCDGAESLNDYIKRPSTLRPQQSYALMWKLNPSFDISDEVLHVLRKRFALLTVLVATNQARSKCSIFRTKRFACAVHIRFRVFPKDVDSGTHNEFLHAMNFDLKEMQLSCSLMPNSTKEAIPRVGTFTQFRIKIALINGDEDDCMALKKFGSVSYSVVVDNKQWMASGQVISTCKVVPATDTNQSPHKICLLPLVAGLLPLPKVKVHWQSANETVKTDLEVINLTNSTQVKVLPSPANPAVMRLSLF